MTESGAFVRRKNGAKLRFDLFRFFALCKPQTVGNADAMRITDNRRLTVNIAQKEICGLSADTRQL